MPPSPKVTKEQLIEAAIKITREQGFDKVTAREVGKVLGTSSRPVFTYYDSMNDLKADVYNAAYDMYQAFVLAGKDDRHSFRASGRQTIKFVQEEPALFELLCFPNPGDPNSSTIGSYPFFENNFDLVKDTIEKEFGLNGSDAKSFFRNVWLFTLGIAMLIISGSCPYSNEEIHKIMGEITLSAFKIYRDFPGLSEGKVDIGRAFEATYFGRKLN